MESPKAFRDILKRLRTEAGYNKTQLAKKAKISCSYVSQLEAGKKPPTDRVIRILSRALEIPENRLFSTIGKVEMDLAGTLAASREKVRSRMPDLTSDEIEALAEYLTYLEFKAAALK